MKSAHDHLAEIRYVALKLADRSERAMEKSRRGIEIGDELASIRQLVESVHVLQLTHALIYGNGGPEPVGIMGMAVKSDATMPKGHVDFVQDGNIVGRIDNLGEDA